MAFVAPTDGYLLKLRGHIHSQAAMRKSGFVIAPLTEEELLLKRRCEGCRKTMGQLGKRALETPAPTSNAKLEKKSNENKTPEFRCKYHPGKTDGKYWSCCNQHVSRPPCSGSHVHIPQTYAPGELEQLNQFHYTPTKPPPGADIRQAVAFDCEMGSATSGDSELIRITMIDYFTSEILVNNLVEPDVPMQHLNTKYSGVTWADFGRARREGSCLRGKVGARNAIWRFVGTDTVVTGHGTSNDFRSLRWIHPLVVDSSVIEGKFASARRALAAAAAKKAKEEAEMLEAVGGEMMEAVEGEIVTRSKETKKHVEIAPEPHKTKKGEGDCSLKTLTEKRLGRKIQTAGNRGHDSLEDAIAARDVVNWIIMNPDFVR